MTPPNSAPAGRRATRSGQNLERIVQGQLEHMDFVTVTHKRYLKIKDLPDRPKRLLVRNAPYTTIYKTTGKTEFLLDCLDPKGTVQFPFTGSLICRIECKRQKSSGSVDEKYPYLYLCCVDSMTETNIILLCEIKGARQAAQDWLKNAVLTRPYTDPTKASKKIHLMKTDDFITWAEAEFDD